MHFSVSSANDTIKVLMLESASDRQPSEKAEKIVSLDGKVFINGRSYTGSIEIMEDQDGLYVINSIPFEKYIEGVVAAEVGKDWETEALKAQAVISSTYAAYNRDMNLNRDYDLTSMMKRKEKIRGLALITVALLGIGFLLWEGGFLPLAGYEAIIVVCFPIFVVCLFLWWMAREHGGDIPFIGY